jgi:hypothetical protein
MQDLPQTRCITVDDEWLVEVRQLQYWACCQGLLERAKKVTASGDHAKAYLRSRVNGEQWRHSHACQSQKATEWPGMHGFHLGGIHGHAPSWYDVAQAGYGLAAKDALVVLHWEMVVLAQHGEDKTNMLKCSDNEAL